MVALPGFERTVTPAYREASLRWWAGETLYPDQLAGFVYLPQFAIGFSPIAWLPFSPGEALWRVLTIGTLALGVRRLARAIEPHVGMDTFFLLTVFTLPLAWGAARNGQTNLPLCASFIFLADALQRRQWTIAALWACLALVLKPIAVVPILLAAPLFPRFALRMGLALPVLAALPFVFGRPQYVVASYAGFVDMFRASSVTPSEGALFSDVFRMLRTFGVIVDERAALALRVLAGAATFGLALLIRRSQSHAMAAIMIAPLSAAYLLLFSPRTENNTYVLAAPFIGWLAVEAWRSRLAVGRVLGWLVVGVWLVMVAQRPIAKALVADDALWLLPLCASALIVVWACVCWIERPRTRREEPPERSALPGETNSA